MDSSTQFVYGTPCHSPPKSPSSPIVFDDDSAMSVSSEEDEFHSLIPKLEAQFSEERYGEAQLLEDPFFGKCIMVVRSTIW